MHVPRRYKRDSIQMDSEAETCQVNDKNNEVKNPPIDEKADTANPNPKNLRSRSRTPQRKCDEGKTLQITLKKMEIELNGKDLVEENEKTEKELVDESKEKKIEKNDAEKIEEQKEESEKCGTESNKSPNSAPTRTSPRINSSPKIVESFKKPDNIETEKDTVEMDPLIITDEPDPELQFDENSDMESGKGSPVIPRCVTRRSQTRNIPTPKTPKTQEQDQESEKDIAVSEEIEGIVPLKKDDLNNTCDSTDTIDTSTKAQVGSDVTRLEYTEKNISVPEDTSYLDASRERSLSETLRCLSARKPIRATDHYRRTVFKNAQQRTDLNLPYPSHDPVEQVITGVKRKDRSATPEETKKMRSDSPGRTSLFSSPFSSIRSRFKSDVPSSTPKLLGYRDAESNLHYQQDMQIADRNGVDEKNSWCSVM
ncbi:hypothetical protein JTB14_006386 [Gonioctena quinquepunctata]|nr:hypothetical protein JTB14_006386 [Gonioctena quinquepunctata]